MLQTKLLLIPTLALCAYKPELSSALATLSVSALAIAETFFASKNIKLSEALDKRIAAIEAQLTRVSLR